jgi:hypothetical protein
MYASVLGISQALHLMLAGESGNSPIERVYRTIRNLMVDLGSGRGSGASKTAPQIFPHIEKVCDLIENPRSEWKDEVHG